MSHWFIPDILSDEAAQAGLENNELVLPADDMPDLSRAQGPEQIQEWLKQLHPDMTPERKAILAQHYWRLSRELLLEDIFVIRTQEGTAYMIGEVAGAYRQEERAPGMSHIWPVQWRKTSLSAESLAAFKRYGSYPAMTEITDETALKSLKPHVPALQKSNATIFRWVAIGTLIFELIYFWPRH